jgi:hypothetical protein
MHRYPDREARKPHVTRFGKISPEILPWLGRDENVSAYICKTGSYKSTSSYTRKEMRSMDENFSASVNLK